MEGPYEKESPFDREAFCGRPEWVFRPALNVLLIVSFQNDSPILLYCCASVSDNKISGPFETHSIQKHTQTQFISYG